MLIRDTNIKIDSGKCIACGICVDRCIMDNLRLSIAPCRQSCPLHLNCQGYVRMLANGIKENILDTMKMALPFIGILSKACHAPCEKACLRKKIDASIPIRKLKRAAIDIDPTYLERASRVKVKDTGRKICVIGGGPAGLMAAWQLRQKGHVVNIIDEKDQLDGQYLIDCFVPDINIEDAKAIIKAIAASGVHFTESNDKKIINFNTLQNSYDAVIITTRNHDILLSLPERCKKKNGELLINSKNSQFDNQESFFVAKEAKTQKPFLVNALASGQKAAEEAHQYLMGIPIGWEGDFWDARGNIKVLKSGLHLAKDRIFGKEKPAENIEDSKRDRTGFSQNEMLSHAKRCLSCGRPFDANATCWYCLPCEIECPHNAIEVKIPYLVR